MRKLKSELLKSIWYLWYLWGVLVGNWTKKISYNYQEARNRYKCVEGASTKIGKKMKTCDFF